MVDSDRRPVSNRRSLLKSVSTYVIISNNGPFQILRLMVDLLLSNRRPFQYEDIYLLLPYHMMDVGQLCTSSALHIISSVKVPIGISLIECCC
jgi:hypothetical protein